MGGCPIYWLNWDTPPAAWVDLGSDRTEPVGTRKACCRSFCYRGNLQAGLPWLCYWWLCNREWQQRLRRRWWLGVFSWWHQYFRLRPQWLSRTSGPSDLRWSASCRCWCHMAWSEDLRFSPSIHISGQFWKGWRWWWSVLFFRRWKGVVPKVKRIWWGSWRGSELWRLWSRQQRRCTVSLITDN